MSISKGTDGGWGAFSNCLLLANQSMCSSLFPR
jgi:hypothetical protein